MLFILFHNVVLSHFRPMEFSIKLHTKESGCNVVYIEGPPPPKKRILILSLANSADSDEMLHYVAFHLDLHCLP